MEKLENFVEKASHNLLRGVNDSLLLVFDFEAYLFVRQTFELVRYKLVFKFELVSAVHVEANEPGEILESVLVVLAFLVNSLLAYEPVLVRVGDEGRSEIFT